MTPSDIEYNAPEFERNFRKVEFEVQGLRLRGKFYALSTLPETPVPAVMYFHGYGPRSNRKSFWQLARNLVGSGVAAFAFDFRGCGNSEGEHSQQRICDMYADALAGYDYLVQQPGIDPARIGIYGSSAGAYLAASLTADRPLRALVLDAPAIYSDEWWNQSIASVEDPDKLEFRREGDLGETRPMRALEKFEGGVFIIAHGQDTHVPQRVTNAYRAQTAKTKPQEYALLEDVKHIHTALSRKYAHKLALDFFLTAL